MSMLPEPSTNRLNAVREACRRVAAEATHVHLDTTNLNSFALELREIGIPPATTDPPDTLLGAPEDVVAYALTLNAINFGSGYSPQLKRPSSLYFTVASALKKRFEAEGAFSPRDLAGLTGNECGRLFDLPMEPDARHELTAAYCVALNALGALVIQHFSGRFVDLVAAAKQSAARLVDILTRIRGFDDVAVHRGLPVPFYKRAQLAVADLAIRLSGQGWGRFDDLNDLTAFADNAVPHVLRTHGVLIYDERLASRIEAGILLPAGCAEEVEIRACAVDAVERIVGLLKIDCAQINALAVDSFLWHRAHDPMYQQRVRHLTRTLFY